VCLLGSRLCLAAARCRGSRGDHRCSKFLHSILLGARDRKERLLAAPRRGRERVREDRVWRRPLLGIKKGKWSREAGHGGGRGHALCVSP
jgi:hypothetical protein